MNSKDISSPPVYNHVHQSFYEYTLVVHPAESVNNLVVDEKQHFYNHYGASIAVKTQPHITLANFFAREGMEETLIRWIQRISSQQPAFLVTLNNYSGFPPDTIYLRIQDPLPLHFLIQQLKVINDFIQSSSCPPLQLARKPHLTIARELTKEVYERALKDYAQKDFHESFMVHEMVLLKRSNQFEACKRVNIFHFSTPNEC